MPYKNPEDIKKYRDANKEKQKKYFKEYRNSEKGKRSERISSWKYAGLVSDDYDAIYDRWMNTNNCDCCNISIKEGKAGKVMDHCHKTRKFRNILCHNCNIMRFHKDNNYQAYVKMLTMD